MKLYAFIALLTVFALADCVSYGPKSTIVTNQTPIMQVNVDITSSGFDAPTVTISKGGTVTWTNKGSLSAWVASAVHPTHQEYPGFDELASMAPGESWSYTFNNVGSWRYHNHLNPSQFGTVNVVEETAVA